MKKILQIIFLVFIASCSTVKPPQYTDTPQPLFGRVLDVVSMPFGQDTLGAAKFPQVSASTVHPGEGRGHFSNLFGDAIPTVKAEIAHGVGFERLHLMWKDNHQFSPSDFPSIVAEAKRVCPTIEANPQIHWYLSGACEHNLNQSNARLLAQKVLAACPAAAYVNTPLGNKGAVLPEYINESHGGGKPLSARFSFSSDGNASEDSDIESLKKTFAGAEYFMMWGPRYNGRWESNDSTPRPNRKGWPDVKYVQSLVYLTTNKGPIIVPKNWLWKSHSENKGTNDPRAEHPVAIIPPKANQIILKKGNVIVGVLPYYGTYVDGRFRYYDSKWGFERGTVDLWINGQKKATVNEGFRDGGFR